jgi:hypothetical protein
MATQCQADLINLCPPGRRFRRNRSFAKMAEVAALFNAAGRQGEVASVAVRDGLHPPEVPGQ